MYNLNLSNNEKVLLIDDNILIKNKEKYYTIIITNERLLILDYPNVFHNSNEDLRTSGKMNYIKMKEIIESINLALIKNIEEGDAYSKIIFKNDSYLEIKSKNVIQKIMTLI